MKKLASVVLASAMAVVPFAAGLAATFTPGEYEASAQGFGGAVTVKVTVDEEKVTAVTVTGEGETPTLGGAAIEGYNTSLVGVSDADAVDATAGATVTSTAVKDALARRWPRRRAKPLRTMRLWPSLPAPTPAPRRATTARLRSP